MKTHAHDRINDIISNNALIVKAFEDGARAALRRHRQAGVPVVVSKHSKMIVVQVEELILEKKHRGFCIPKKTNQGRIRRKKMSAGRRELVKRTHLHVESIERA